MRNKKGELTTRELIELILAAAFIIVLVILAARLLAPFFDVGDETAESYMDTLVQEMGIARNDGIGEFFIWDIDTGDSTTYHLVYFGEKVIVRDEIANFTSDGLDNNICICSVFDEKSRCNNCVALDFPSRIEGGSEEGFVISKGERVAIEFTEDESYEFRKV